MANDFTFTIDSQDYIRLTRMLSSLSKIEQDAVVKKGLQEGVSVIKRQGKADLKSSGIHLNNVYSGKRANKGHLINSFRTYIKKGVRSDGMRGYGGFKRPEGSVAHLIDRGTDKRYTKKPYTDRLGRSYPAGMYRGNVTANYFWTNAVEKKGDKAMSELVDSITKSINKIIDRNRNM